MLFVLSGERKFTEQGVNYDFQRFYDMQIELLTKESSKKGKRFGRLLDYFNGHLFTAGDDEMDERRRMTDEERRLLDAIEGDSGDEESGDHDDHGSGGEELVSNPGSDSNL
jgi:hypothetical protein